jgi:hypothetical protein
MKIREKCKGSAPILRKRTTTCLEPQSAIPPKLTQLGNNRLQLVQISLVLSLVLDLLLDTLQDPDSGRVIVDLSGCPQGSLDDRGGGDEIVSETVVQASLELKDVLDVGEEGLVTLVEGFVGFGLVSVGAARVESDGCGRRRKSS